jgi:predicted glycoside hydrolase/deacetylase ChbG (UPF0249 family)
VKIVFNADDFGWSSDTVSATIECFERGALTSASIMLGKSATEEAIEFALEHPQHSYGVHLTFVGDGDERSTAPAAEVPSLVDAQGRLRRTNAVRALAATRRLPLAQLRREIAAQLEFVVARGVPLSHVDSHRHLHKFGVFRRALADVLPHFGVERLRNAQDVYIGRHVTSPTYWYGRSWRRRLMGSFTTTDHFFMPSGPAPAAFEVADLIARLSDDESLEIGVHPGRAESWREGERRLVLELAALAREQGHRLIRWSDVRAA